MKNENTMSIFAQALASNRNYKNAHIDGVTVGIDNVRAWRNAIVTMLNPAYEIRVKRHDNMGNKDEISIDQTAFYNALHEVLRLVGEVNGDKLNAKNCGEEIIACAVRTRTIDTSDVMAHARCVMRSAKKSLSEAYDKTYADDTAMKSAISPLQTAYDNAVAEVKRLEGIAGNCKKILEMQSESAFRNSVELLLGDAITKQTMRPLADIIAEKEARKAERANKRKANKQNKTK